MLEHFSEEFVPAQVIRKSGPGSFIKGIWVPDSDAVPESIRVIAPQPVNARELQMLPDGEHVRNYLKTWTEADVETREGELDSDKLDIFGTVYKVVQVENREPLGQYRKVFIREIRPDE
jgi:hypothetical protein